MESWKKFEYLSNHGYNEYDFWAEMLQWLPEDEMNEFKEHMQDMYDIESTEDIDEKLLWDEIVRYLPEDILKEFAGDFESLYL